MNVRFKSCLFFTFMAALYLSACSFGTQLPSQEQKFLDLYPGIPMTGYFRFTIIDMGTRDHGFSVSVDNTSREKILIDLSNDHEIYLFDEVTQEWIMIPELIQPIYVSPSLEDMQLLLNTEEDFQETGESFFYPLTTKPDLSNISKPVTVRVVVTGEVIESNKPTGKKVGGFVDILVEE